MIPYGSFLHVIFIIYFCSGYCKGMIVVVVIPIVLTTVDQLFEVIVD